MTNAEIKYVNQVQAQYAPKGSGKLDELKALNKKVNRPANIFAYTFGTVGALVLGGGMSLAMEVLAGGMLLGVGIGVVGLAMVSLNYFFHKTILKSRRKKYAAQILTLSDQLLND